MRGSLPGFSVQAVFVFRWELGELGTPMVNAPPNTSKTVFVADINAGVFQTYYVRTFPDLSPSTISWIGSIQLCVEILLGTIVGPLYDYGYLRSLVVVGSFLSVLGVLLTSFSTQYWQLLFSQGVLVGIGNGCLFIPSFAVLPNYFEKKRALAVGIAQSGSALGMPAPSSIPQNLLIRPRWNFLPRYFSSTGTQNWLSLDRASFCLNNVHNLHPPSLGFTHEISAIESPKAIGFESLD